VTDEYDEDEGYETGYGGEAEANAGADYPPPPGYDEEEEIAERARVADPRERGEVFADPNAGPGGRRSLPNAPRADVNLAVPFIHQLWDTPDEFNGHWACGPTSTAMVLAYYGRLEPHPITVHAPRGLPPHESPFGWYLPNVFPHAGRTFDRRAGTPEGTAQGLYGSIVGAYCGGGWCAGANDILSVMRTFLAPIGNTVEFAWARDAGPDRLRNVLDAGHPIVVSGKLFGWDHLIVIRGYFRDGDTTRWICNDPYGYQTDRSYDGGNVVYDWAEIRPKWMVIPSGAFVP
jgi:hypothetical protein